MKGLEVMPTQSALIALTAALYTQIGDAALPAGIVKSLGSITLEYPEQKVSRLWSPQLIRPA